MAGGIPAGIFSVAPEWERPRAPQAGSLSAQSVRAERAANCHTARWVKRELDRVLETKRKCTAAPKMLKLRMRSYCANELVFPG